MELAVKFEETNQEFDVEFEGYIVNEDGYDDGFKEGYNQGHLDGYDEGNEDGYIVGMKNGYQEGYDDGNAEGIKEGIEEGKAEGYADGANAEKQKCASKHYTATVKGSGTTELQFYLPFEPDALMVQNFDPTNRYADGIVAQFVADFRSLGLICATSHATRTNGNLQPLAMSTTSVYTRYSRADDGTTILGNISAYNSKIAVFDANVEYSVVACNYTDKTDKELYTELVNRVPNSGTVQVCQAKVKAAFTDDEWSALIATKPNVTFAFV